MKRFAILLLLLSSTFSLARVQLIGKVKRGDGTLFNGKVVVTLPVATQDTSLSEAVCPCQFEYPVQNGTFPSNAFLVATDIMSPSNVYYIMQFFDPYGNLKMTLNAANVIDAAGTYDIGQATPTAITTAQISYITPASLSANQVWTGNNTFSQPIISTVATGTPPLTVASTTPVANLGASHIVGDRTPLAATAYPTAVGRFAKNDQLCWRNSDNTGDNCVFFQAGAGGASSLDTLFQSTNSGAQRLATSYKLVNNTFGNTAIVNLNTENTMMGGAGGINANDFFLGDTYRAHIDGVLTNTSGGNITYTLRMREDAAGVLMCASAGVVVATGAVAVPFHLECDFSVQATGAGGTIGPWGNYTVNATSGDIGNAALVAIDTTINHNFVFTEQMSVASAVGSITARQEWLERIGR